MRKINFFVLLLVGGCNQSIPQQNVEIFTQNKEGIIQGVTISGSKVKSIIAYRRDSTTKEGAATYFTNDIIDSFVNWHNGNMVGSGLLYEKGVPSLYICRDSYGDTIFLRKFKGKSIEFDSGQLLPHGYTDIDNLKNDSTVVVTNFVPSPPYTFIEVKDYIVNVKTNDTVFPVKSRTKYDWIRTSTFKLTLRGVYVNKTIFKLNDTLGSPGKIIMKTDTFGLVW